MFFQKLTKWKFYLFFAVSSRIIGTSKKNANIKWKAMVLKKKNYNLHLQLNVVMVHLETTALSLFL